MGRAPGLRDSRSLCLAGCPALRGSWPCAHPQQCCCKRAPAIPPCPCQKQDKAPPGTAAAQRLSPGTAWPWLQPSGTQLPEAEAEPDSNLIAQGSNHIRGGEYAAPRGQLIFSASSTKRKREGAQLSPCSRGRQGSKEDRSLQGDTPAPTAQEPDK